VRRKHGPKYVPGSSEVLRDRFVTPFAPFSNKSLRTFGTLEPTITVRREVLSMIPVSGE
jgi:hypothetical protein